jgi:hypothetical protein
MNDLQITAEQAAVSETERAQLHALLLEAADTVRASQAETDISDHRRTYRIGLEQRLRNAALSHTIEHSRNLERQRDEAVAERDAERTARKALEEALWRANQECCQIGHPKSDQHDYDAPCPVEARIVAALTLASKLP